MGLNNNKCVFSDLKDAIAKYTGGIGETSSVVFYDPRRISTSDRNRIIQEFRAGLLWFVSFWKKNTFVYLKKSSVGKRPASSNPRYKINVRTELSTVRLILKQKMANEY